MSMAGQGRAVFERPLISVIDDDVSMREALVGLMQAFGFEARAFASAAAFLDSDRLCGTACLIVDLHMPGVGGLELQRRLLSAGHRIPTIFITAFPDADALAQALRAGAVGYLIKPFRHGELMTMVCSAIRRHPESS